MTAGQQANMAFGDGKGYGVNITVHGGDPTLVGWYPAAGMGGAITPNNQYGGIVIDQLISYSGGDFKIRLVSFAPQNFFDKIVVQATDGSFRTYLSSTALYTGGNEWNWPVAGTKLWTAGGLRSVIISPAK